MREIQEHKIKIYEFPETDDEEENKLVKKIKVCMHQFPQLMNDSLLNDSKLHIFKSD